MKTILTPLLILIVFFFCKTSLAQTGDGFPAIFETAQAGDWDDSNTWTDLFGDESSSDGVPDGDDVVIVNHNVSLTKNESFDVLNIENVTGSIVRLTIPSGDSLIGVGAVTVLGSASSFAMAQVACSGYLSCAGLGVIAGNTGGRGIFQVKDGGHLIVDGDITLSAAASATNCQLTANVLNSGTQNQVDISGSISGTAGVVSGANGAGPHNSLFNFNGTSAQIINVNSSYTATYGDVEINNTSTVTTDTAFTSSNLLGYFTVNSGTFTHAYSHEFSDSVANHATYNVSDSMDIEGSFTNTGTLTSSGSRINLAGDWNNSGTYTYFAGDTVTFDGSSLQSITGSTTFSVLELSNTANNTPSHDVEFISGAFIIDSIFDINDCIVDNESGATITLSSTETRTAQMIDVGSFEQNAFEGSIEVQRKLVTTTHGWRELGSPVDGVTIEDWRDDGITMAGFTGSDFPYFSWNSVFYYIEANANGTKNNGWEEPTDTGERVETDKGFRLYTGNIDVDLSVSGNPRMGDQDIAVTNNCTTCTEATDFYEDGWNLITNPYPCAVNWNALSEANRAGVDSIIYIYEAQEAAYAWYVLGDPSPAGGMDSIISHSQAFWVHASTVFDEIEFRESHKVAAETKFVKSTGTMPKNRMNVRMTSASHDFEDVAVLNVLKGASSNFDRSKDFHKKYSPLIDEVPSLAFVSDDDFNLCFASIGEESTSILLKAFAGSAVLGTYTLDFENMNNFVSGACVTLEDLVTGVTQDLKSNPTYSYVTLAEDDSMARFIIHIEKQYDVTASDATCANLSDGSIEINHKELTTYNVSWTDSDGTILDSAISNNENFVIENLPSAIYEVTVLSNCALPNESIEVGQPDAVIADFNVSSTTVEVDEIIDLTNNSAGSSNYLWQMGDGKEYQDFEPIHAYEVPGTYTIELLTTSANFGDCRDKKTQIIEVNSSSVDIDEAVINTLNAFESGDNIIIRSAANALIESIDLYNVSGKLISQISVNASIEVQIPSSTLAAGVYILNAKTENGIESCKVTIK
ncbi:MAG: T9SS type A sorting domain-containing protein [Crocinitomicaceae bacterium]|nr:T9SS type A sorting domain-containing protein [Crocinitomicaceae bacterium]